MDMTPNTPPAAVGIYPGSETYSVYENMSLEIKLVLLNQSNSGDFIKLGVSNINPAWVTIHPSQFIFLDRGKTENVSLKLSLPPGSAGSYELVIAASRRDGLELVGQARVVVRVLKSEAHTARQPVYEPEQAGEKTARQAALPDGYQSDNLFKVELGTARLSLAPGDERTIPLCVTNQDMETDIYSVSVESKHLPSAWIAIIPGNAELNPRQQHTFQIKILPPRKPASAAGLYPFTVKVQSRRHPAQSVRLDCVLTVTAYHQNTVQVAPLQVYAGQPIHVTVDNGGNAPDTLEVSWAVHDQEDEVIFEVLPAPPVLVTPGAATQAVAVTQVHPTNRKDATLLRVEAGKSASLQFKVIPNNPPVFGRPRHYSFDTRVSGSDHKEQTFPCAVTVQPLVPTWALVTLLLICFFSLSVIIWLLTRSGSESNHQKAAVETQVAYSLTQTAWAGHTAVAMQIDSDGDGLLDSVEIGLGTNPGVADTDIDGLIDGVEVNDHKTDPKIADSDQDGLVDGDEIARGTNPHSNDTDADQLKDGDEIRLGTDPKVVDSDLDGLDDGDETSSCLNPLDSDTDDDGILDGDDLDPCDKHNPALTQTAVALTPSVTVTSTPTPTLTPIPWTPTATTAPPSATPTPTATPILPGLPGSLLFSSNREGRLQIYLRDMNTGDITRLTVSNGDDTLPSWSPDGSRIAFTSNRDGNQEVYIMDANGANPVNLTNHPAADSHPAWSPDGAWIAFSTNRDGNDEIYLIRADGSELLNISNHPANDSQPDWEAIAGIESVGGSILFVTDRDGNQEIYKMSPDGQFLLNLSNHAAQDYQPVYSPNGRRIAFISDRNGNPDIYIMNADGSNLRNLTQDSNSSEESPTWSSDNEWIACSANLAGNFEIYVITYDGSLRYNITIVQGDDRDPAWR